MAPRLAPGIWLATIMFECSGPAAATGASRATGITWLSEAVFTADDGFDATPEARHAERVVSQRADVWQAAAALPASVGPGCGGTTLVGRTRVHQAGLGVGADSADHDGDYGPSLPHGGTTVSH
jgi:hypothetical protein